MKRKHDIDNHKSRMTRKIVPLTLALAVLVLTTQISLFQFIKPAMAANLSNVRVIPSTNIVNERATYDIFFTTATTGTIQFIAMIFPGEQGVASSFFDISAATKLIERSGIGPGFLTTVSGVPGLLVYVVNSPVSIPAGTEIRLEIGTIGNPNTAGSFQVTLATLNINAAILDASLSPSFAIKDITGADISPNFMIRKTLKDDSAGNAKGWNPDDVSNTFTIMDSDINGNPDSTFVSVGVKSVTVVVCSVGQMSTASGIFRVDCNQDLFDGAELHYVISKLPPHLITSSLSSSEPSSTPPFTTPQDTGSINRQDEYSSEFP